MSLFYQMKRGNAVHICIYCSTATGEGRGGSIAMSPALISILYVYRGLPLLSPSCPFPLRKRKLFSCLWREGKCLYIGEGKTERLAVIPCPLLSHPLWKRERERAPMVIPECPASLLSHDSIIYSDLYHDSVHTVSLWKEILLRERRNS